MEQGRWGNDNAVAMTGPGVDSHAHVFTRNCALARDRRYTPVREAPLDGYLAALDRHGISHAVLVQPSFLGTANDYLLDSLKTVRSRLRGVVVVDRDIGDDELDAMAAAGVVGIRLNLIGIEDHADALRLYDRALLERVVARGWHIDIQASGLVFAKTLDRVLTVGAPVVVDHFGRPNPRAGLEDPGFRTLLSLADEPNLWVKLSGPYRFTEDPAPYAAALLGVFTPQRLLWGSDWPWTQFESGRDYGTCLGWLADWVPDAAQRRAILWDNPSALYGLTVD